MNDLIENPAEAKQDIDTKTIGSIIPGPMLHILLDRAHKQPRDEQLALETALQELRHVPKLAERAYYSIPYTEEGGSKKPVEGLTIGSSMALARRWGNLITGGLITSEDGNGWDIMGVCLDLESIAYNARPSRASKFYKPKGSDGLRMLQGQHRQNALLSVISKTIRTATLWTLPAWLRDAYFEEAKKLVLAPPKAHAPITMSIQERILKARAVFAKKYQVTEDEMNAYLMSLALEDDSELLAHLQGLYNAFEEGSAKVDDVFGREKKTPDMPTAKK